MDVPTPAAEGWTASPGMPSSARTGKARPGRRGTVRSSPTALVRGPPQTPIEATALNAYAVAALRRVARYLASAGGHGAKDTGIRPQSSFGV